MIVLDADFTGHVLAAFVALFSGDSLGQKQAGRFLSRRCLRFPVTLFNVDRHTGISEYSDCMRQLTHLSAACFLLSLSAIPVGILIWQRQGCLMN